MWDEQDYTARWVQGISAVFLAAFTVGGVYLMFNAFSIMLLIGGIPVCLASTRLCWRCTRYAITGRGNVNRDSY
ncbi:MAG TPA: hypothetical protein VGN16_19855 [Acidobacteriaceae bacterium]|jgi:hypothetical protein